MTRTFWYPLIGLFLGLALGNTVTLYGENERLKDHIQYLEEYIQDNNLPTPAFRIDTGRFNIEIGE